MKNVSEVETHPVESVKGVGMLLIKGGAERIHALPRWRVEEEQQTSINPRGSKGGGG